MFRSTKPVAGRQSDARLVRTMGDGRTSRVRFPRGRGRDLDVSGRWLEVLLFFCHGPKAGKPQKTEQKPRNIHKRRRPFGVQAEPASYRTRTCFLSIDMISTSPQKLQIGLPN